MEPIETQRLRLRQWTDGDLEPFARLNADPEVMRHFPAPLSRGESDAMVERMRAHIEAKGWGFWAVESRASGEFIGMVGIKPVPPNLPFAPAVEVGWRLARAHWGRGYAKEAAVASVAFAFEKLRLPQLVAFTAVLNQPSRALMERLGMDCIDTFEHPSLPVGSPLRPHVLYALRRGAWERTREGSTRIGFPCGTFRAREVVPEELPALQLFYEANPGYFRIVQGEPPSSKEARDSLESLPPADWPFTRKYLIAFRARDDAIVAVADVVSNLFSRGVWHIGFFMAADTLHGTGVPHALYAHLEAWMRSQGARWLRLGVVRGNGRAERFWQKMGYVDVAERRDYPQGVKRHTLRVMAKAVAGGGWDEYRELVPRDREASVEAS